MEVKSVKLEEVDQEAIQHAIRYDLGICRDLYHGTSKFISQKIVKTKKIKCGNNCSYLGYGIYCYLHDEKASKLWARNKHKDEKIAVCKLVANLGNILFVDQELSQFLRETVNKISKKPIADINDEVGLLLEEIIETHIESDYRTTIHSVCRTYQIGGKHERPATMYALRKEEMVKDVKSIWEEL